MKIVSESILKRIGSKKIELGYNAKSNLVSPKLIAEINKIAQNAKYFHIGNNTSSRFLINQDTIGRLFITTKNSQPLFKKIDTKEAKAINLLIENIDKLCYYTILMELEIAQENNNDKNIDIQVFEMGVGEAKKHDDGYYFYYKKDNDNNWQPPQLTISLTYLPGKALMAKPIYLDFDYGVNSTVFESIQLAETPITIKRKKVGQMVEILPLQIDKKYAALGYNQITEYLKIFISAKDFELDSLSQTGLELEKKQDEKRNIKSTKAIALEDNNNDWQVFTVKLTVSKPSEMLLSAKGSSSDFGFKIINNSLLNGKIGITTMAEAQQRSYGGIDVPKQLDNYDGNDNFLSPAQLMAGHGQGQSSNMLEIFDAQNINSVTNETPIIIQPSQIIEPDEAVIPFGFDPVSKSYFPLGTTDQHGQIIINQLPSETPSDSAITKRSFLGSIKIYFYKIVGQKIGLKYDYPQLSKVAVDDTENVTYEKDLQIIQAACQKANKIVVFIHGIIGDTEEMVKVVKRAKSPEGKLLFDQFDLLLAFDYENLSTKIQDTAADLKSRLEAIGIGENTNKELVIVAHSMGGLVSRYFIEKLNGDKVVSHLIMLGTPNGGSEWADVRDLADTLLTNAVNGAVFLKPWLIPLSFVGKLFTGVQTTLKQMNDKGDLSIMPILNDGTIPKTRYSIIAGNTKLMGNSAKIESALKSIITRLKEKPVYAGLDLAVFQNEPNDIAVKVRNIKKINQPISEIYEVASDHISYFGTAESIEKLGALV